MALTWTREGLPRGGPLSPRLGFCEGLREGIEVDEDFGVEVEDEVGVRVAEVGFGDAVFDVRFGQESDDFGTAETRVFKLRHLKC